MATVPIDVPGALQRPAPAKERRAVAAWLLACCVLVFAMVVVGGVTRLTHSGLSIVEWQPLVGTIPPLTESAWEQTFARYRETPEFRLVNHDMTLEAFKGIFWWEYFHRLLGRLIGVAFFVPFAVFLARRRIDFALAGRLFAIFLLGGLQGALGWYMVKSGLVDDPRVSQFRLTAHLGLALVIFAAMLWVALGLLLPRATGIRPALRRGSAALAGLVLAMALSGGMVAGIRAGFAYNTFPLMNGSWIAPEILMLEPWYLNFGYNMATVQFVHRALALVLALAAPLAWFAVRRDPAATPAVRWAAHALLVALAIQIALGIATLLLAVPVSLAAAHQAGAVLVFSAAIALRRAMS